MSCGGASGAPETWLRLLLLISGSFVLELEPFFCCYRGLQCYKVLCEGTKHGHGTPVSVGQSSRIIRLLFWWFLHLWLLKKIKFLIVKNSTIIHSQMISNEKVGNYKVV